MFLGRMYEEKYFQINNYQLRKIAKLTGCIKPCYYKKYQVIGEKIPTALKSDLLTFSFWAVSEDTTVEKEMLVYPWTSLVAEFGGTLGLFLGFSFIAGWDGALRLAGWGRASLAQGF
jgi:hypothetical protein